jgi:hypothetical protein
MFLVIFWFMIDSFIPNVSNRCSIKSVRMSTFYARTLSGKYFRRSDASMCLKVDKTTSSYNGLVSEGPS